MPSRQDLSPFTIFAVTCMRVDGRVFFFFSPELPKFPVKKKKKVPVPTQCHDAFWWSDFAGLEFFK